MTELSLKSSAITPDTLMKARTISVIDEDEFQIHKLYRERIMQEDVLINHRMTWMILSQALLLACWGGLVNRFFANENAYTGVPADVIAAIALVLALGSKLSIRSAQDEIEELRRKYLQMYRLERDPKPRGFKGAIWHSLYWLLDFRMFFPNREEDISHVPVMHMSVPEAHVLPGLTGSSHFHQTGHLLPKGMPILMMAMWCYLLHRLGFYRMIVQVFIPSD